MHILNRPALYQKPLPTRAFISLLVGESLFSSEGAKHRRQRRIAEPAFSSQSVKTFLPIVFAKVARLTNQWTSIIDISDSASPVIDVVGWAHRATLDVIGEVAFGVNFDSLIEESSDVSAILIR